MKYILTMLIFTIHSYCLLGQGFIVKLKINNLNDHKVSLVYEYKEKIERIENYDIIDDIIVFKGYVEQPVVANIVIHGHKDLRIPVDSNTYIPGPHLDFFLSNDEINIYGDAKTIYAASVHGGLQNREWSSIKPFVDILKGSRWLLNKKMYRNGDVEISEVEKSNLTLAINEIDNLLEIIRNEFLLKNKNSLVSFYYLQEMMNSLSLQELESKYDSLSSSFKNHYYARTVSDRISTLHNSKVGIDAVNFDGTDSDGRAFNLNDLKGKYVIIDFWGSWCEPCRKSHPHLIEVYSKYKDSGLEVIGVANEGYGDITTLNRLWKEAIIQDNLPYRNILYNNEMKRIDIIKIYGITSYPTKVIIDKEGKIIDRLIGVDNNKLDDKMKELFGF